MKKNKTFRSRIKGSSSWHHHLSKRWWMTKILLPADSFRTYKNTRNRSSERKPSLRTFPSKKTCLASLMRKHWPLMTRKWRLFSSMILIWQTWAMKKLDRTIEIIQTSPSSQKSRSETLILIRPWGCIMKARRRYRWTWAAWYRLKHPKFMILASSCTRWPQTAEFKLWAKPVIQIHRQG